MSSASCTVESNSRLLFHMTRVLLSSSQNFHHLSCLETWLCCACFMCGLQLVLRPRGACSWPCEYYPMFYWVLSYETTVTYEYFTTIQDTLCKTHVALLSSNLENWTRLLAWFCGGDTRNDWISVGKPLGKQLIGKPKRRWKVNIKTIRKEVGFEIGGTGEGSCPVAGFRIELLILRALLPGS
jgi:hypothetical protein